jgi:YHS domain-containing protein
MMARDGYGALGMRTEASRYDVYSRFARRHLSTPVARAVYLTLVGQEAESWSGGEMARHVHLDPAETASVLEEFLSVAIVEALDSSEGRRYRWSSDMDYLFLESGESFDRIDPVCGMPVTGDTPYIASDADRWKWRFCSSECLAVFQRSRARIESRRGTGSEG